MGVQQTHHESTNAYAHGVIDLRKAYARLAYILLHFRRLRGLSVDYEEQPILDEWNAMQKYRDEIMPDGPHIQEPPLMEWSAALYLAASLVEGRCHGQSDSDPAATSGAPFPLRLLSRAEERAQREGPAPPATPQSPLPRVRPRLPPPPMAGEPRSQMYATAVEAHQEQAVPVPRSPRVRST